MAQNWYYARGNDQFGPVTIEQLKGLIGTGQVQMADLVWTEGMGQWAAAQSVPELVAQTTANPYAPTMPPSANPYVANPYAANPAAQNPAWPGQPSPGVLGYQTPMYATQPYAGFWLRFCAAFIDGILVAIVAAIIEAGAHSEGMGFLVRVVGGWLYFALMESSQNQATLGKMALGLKVTDMNGNRLSFGHATGRHFGKYISILTLFIGYILAGVTEKKQALHDMMAGTLVVRKQA